jgi:predicted nucleotidyltransferase
MTSKIKHLNNNQACAVEAFIKRVKQKTKLDKAIVFGSAVTGKAEVGSDLDIFIVTENQLSHRERHSIQNISTEINWEFDTNISATIVDRENWEHGLYSLLLIKDEIIRDGVEVY